MNGTTVKIELGGEVVWATEETWNEKADALHRKHGGVPKVTVEKQPETQPAPIQAGQHDVVGEVRSLDHTEALLGMGFAPKQPLYRRGTRVNQTGVDNARAFRVEHDKKPTVQDYCADFADKVRAEERSDTLCDPTDLRMSSAGQLVLPKGLTAEGETTWKRMDLEHRAFPQLVARLGMPAGAGTYLREVWPHLRALNVNNWAKFVDHASPEQRAALGVADSIKLRERLSADGGREVYGVVGEKYASFDVDKVADAIALATPKDARGTVTYDGYRARFEVLFHSDVQPEEYVAGEYFKAGVVIRTDDTGGGSLRGSAVVWQNLCLNLIVIDQAEQEAFALRHVGSVRTLAEKFQVGFREALAKIEHFQQAWGYACREDVAPAGVPIEQAIPGLMRGIVERELVPVRGRTEQAVKQLVQMWELDRSGATKHHGGATRAAIVNAATRWAHEVNDDPWLEDDMQRAAGALVYSRTPLPFIAEAT